VELDCRGDGEGIFTIYDTWDDQDILGWRMKTVLFQGMEYLQERTFY
jgi:hypothetical protein